MKSDDTLRKELQLYLEQLEREITEAAERMTAQSLPEITEELFALYEQCGNRLRYEEVYFGKRKFLSVFAVKALMEKAEKGTVSESVLRKLTQVIESICEEVCWALPAHVNRRTDKDWQVTVDLFAAETAESLADIGDTFRSLLSEKVYAEIVENVERRVLRPFFSSKPPYGNWEYCKHNWNAVCGGSIGSACLHLLRQEPERLKSCLERICCTLPFYLEGFAEDGTCMEGLGYFSYGMTYYVNFAEELYTYTQGKQDLLLGEKLAKIAAFQSKCYFADGRTVSFSDGNSTERFRVGLSCALGARFTGAKLPNMAGAASLEDDHCYRFAPLKMDYLCTKRYLEQAAPKAAKPAAKEPRFHILPNAQWCICQSEKGAGMACKGGDNGEPHNHNDIGHFLYEGYGEMFLTDLGAGEYTKEYFGEGRYGILCNNSFGHSVPIVNGRGQEAGAEYRCSSFGAEGIQGKKDMVQIIMELQEAYPVCGLDSLQRKLLFDLYSGCLTVEDTFHGKRAVIAEGLEAGTAEAKEPETAPEVIENLVTQIPPRVQDNRIYLEAEQKGKLLTCCIEIEADTMEGPVQIIEKMHSNHAGEAQKVYAMQWKTGSNSCFHVSLEQTVLKKS